MNRQITVDFENNLEIVSVWIDYMIGAKWMYKDTDGGKWTTTGDGKRWIFMYNAIYCNMCGYIEHNLLHLHHNNLI